MHCMSLIGLMIYLINKDLLQLNEIHFFSELYQSIQVFHVPSDEFPLRLRTNYETHFYLIGIP